jgi:TetR/AcrR family transcriptional regulator, transcriptional repressor for nem operon
MARPREFDEERVLDAVMLTFWRKGFEATSAQDLVDATGLGRGSLYGAYSNKERLFEQAILRYNRRSRENIERLRQPGPAIKRLRELFISIIDADLDAAEKPGCLATNTAIELAGRSPHVAGLVRQNFQIMIRGIQEAIERGQSAGEIPRGLDAKVLALFLFNNIQGLRVLTKTMGRADRARLLGIAEQALQALG